MRKNITQKKSTNNPKNKQNNRETMFAWSFIIGKISIFHNIYNDVSKNKAFALITFILGSVLTLIIQQLVKTLATEIITITILVILALWLFIYYTIKRHHQKLKSFVYGCILSIIVLIISRFSIIHFAPNPDICENPQTLHDYFKCDFGQTNTYGRTRTLPITNMFNRLDTFFVKYEFKIVMDFNSLSYFFKFYIYENKHTSVFCDFIPDICEHVINNPDDQNLAILEPFKNKANSLRDLTFTKRVYIYHETVMPPYDIDTLKMLFKTIKYIPEFRGPSWPFLKQNNQDSMFYDIGG